MPEGGRKFCKFEILIYFCSAEKIISAGVAKLVDRSEERRVGE